MHDVLCHNRLLLTRKTMRFSDSSNSYDSYFGRLVLNNKGYTIMRLKLALYAVWAMGPNRCFTVANCLHQYYYQLVHTSLSLSLSLSLSTFSPILSDPFLLPSTVCLLYVQPLYIWYEQEQFLGIRLIVCLYICLRTFLHPWIPLSFFETSSCPLHCHSIA